MSDWNEQYMHAKLSHFMWKINCVHSAISLLRVLILLVESWRKKHNAHTHYCIFFGIIKKFPCFVRSSGPKKIVSLFQNMCISPFCFHFFSSRRFFCTLLAVCKWTACVWTYWIWWNSQLMCMIFLQYKKNGSNALCSRLFLHIVRLHMAFL